MNIRKSRYPLAVAAIAAVFGAGILAGCGGSDSGGGSDGSAGGNDDTLVIGVANGQTGYLAPFDVPITSGVKKMVNELNAEGGIGGRQAEVEVVDTRSDIGEQATKTQQLIDSGADVLVLACDSDPAISGGQVAQRAGVVAFGCPSNPEQVGDKLFQMFSPERAHPTVAAQYAIGQDWTKGYVLGSPDTGYTQNGVDYFETAFEGEGGEIVGSSSFSLDQQDYSGIVQEIKTANPQVVYTTMYEPAIATFLKQLRGAGVDVPVIGDSIESPAVQSLDPDVRKDVYFTSIADTNADAPAGQFVQEVGDEFGADSASVYSIMGADVVSILNAALTETDGSTDGLAEAVAGLTDVEGVQGSISYDWEGSGNTQLRPVLIKSLLGGNKTKVWETVTPDPSTYPPVIE